jgi:MFS family permease
MQLEKEAAKQHKKEQYEALKQTLKDNELRKKKLEEQAKKERLDDIKCMEEYAQTEIKKENERKLYFKRIERKANNFMTGVAKEALDKALVVMLFSISFGGIISYLVLYGTKLGIENLGVYFVVYALCLLVTRPLYGRLADTFGAERVLVPGVIFFAASYVMLANTTDFAGLMAVAVVSSAGFGACMPLVQSLAMQSAPAERRGAASNTIFTGMDVGSLCGPLFAGAVIEFLQPMTGSLLAAYSTMWLVMLAPMAIAFAIIVVWNVRK